MIDAGPRHAFASSLDPGAGDSDVLDFDDNRTWGPKLTAAFGGLLTDNVPDRLVAASPQYIEDACELLSSCADRVRIVGATTAAEADQLNGDDGHVRSGSGRQRSREFEG